MQISARFEKKSGTLKVAMNIDWLKVKTNIIQNIKPTKLWKCFLRAHLGVIILLSNHSRSSKANVSTILLFFHTYNVVNWVYRNDL